MSKSIEEVLNIIIGTCKEQAEHIGKLENLIVRQQGMIDQTIKTVVSINRRVLAIESGMGSSLYRPDGSRILGKTH